MGTMEVVGQAHETFKTIVGDLATVAADFKEFSVREDVQVKSISVLGDGPKFTLSLGYIKGERYPVHLEIRNVNSKDLDESLASLAGECDGDVICHSLFMRPAGIMGCVFLVQGD